jgi:hydroxylaminobenzene mutase
MIKTPNYKLLIGGAFLLLLGFLLGGIIPLFLNPRLALSAHEQGIIAGIFLLLLGLVWPYAVFRRINSTVLSGLLLTGTYLIWIGILVGSILGTSRATPIAGDGFAGSNGQEITVASLLMIGSVITIFGMIVLLISLVRGAMKSQNEK